MCLSACTAQDIFHAMQLNTFLIQRLILQFLYFLNSVHCCLIPCLCAHPGDECRGVADCSHLISPQLCSLHPCSSLELVLLSAAIAAVVLETEGCEEGCRSWCLCVGREVNLEQSPHTAVPHPFPDISLGCKNHYCFSFSGPLHTVLSVVLF